MDCEQVQEQLSGLLDGALDQESVVLVEAHLADCEMCRAQKEALTALDASLNRAFAAERGGGDRVAARVVEQLAAADVPEPSYTPILSWRRVLGYVVAAAAGFLLAMLVFPSGQLSTAPPERSTATQTSRAEGDASWTAPATVAQLVHTTGPISYRSPTGGEWEQVEAAQLPVFGCPSDSSVRTAPGALAELKTPGGSRIRLNESSEVAFVSDQELELKQGQIWCRAAGADTLRVITGESPAPPQNPAQLQALVCGTSSEFVAACSPAQAVQVVSAAGNVEVSAGGRAQMLSAGRSCTIANGSLEVRESEGDFLHAQRWMQPLLILGGHGNPELTQRVDALLARIGRTKLAHLYEQDLRNLGEYGALPLLRFVQSQPSRQEPDRRQTATNILADTAPIWMVPDLIDLLEDDDPAIRVAAARGLSRLTGTDHGVPAEQWEGDLAERAAAVSLWRQWWQQHRFACPAPPADLGSQWERKH